MTKPALVNHSRFLRRLISDRAGVSTMQYGVILGLVAIGSMTALKGLGGETKKSFNKVGTVVAANRANADPFANGQAVAPAPEMTPSVGAPTSSGGAFEPAAARSAPFVP